MYNSKPHHRLKKRIDIFKGVSSIVDEVYFVHEPIKAMRDRLWGVEEGRGWYTGFCNCNCCTNKV